MKRIAFLLILLVPVLLFAQERPRRRGKFLRSEIRNAEITTEFQFQPVPVSGSFLAFRFQGVQTRSYQEVRLYEVVEEVTKFNDGQGVIPDGTVEYRPVPNAVMEGEILPHHETTVLGPLKNEKFLLMGKEITTDENGLWIDATQEILAKFDTLSQTSLEITASRPEGQPQSFTLTRFLLKKQEEHPIPGVQRPNSIDILEAMGMDFTRDLTPSSEKFSASVKFPNKAETDSFHPITVTVTNEEDKPVRNLIGCIFSSDVTLNGKLFYFGKLPPGKSLSFSRVLQMPSREGDCFFTIAFWSILGPMKGPRLHHSITLHPVP